VRDHQNAAQNTAHIDIRAKMRMKIDIVNIGGTRGTRRKKRGKRGRRPRKIVREKIGVIGES